MARPYNCFSRHSFAGLPFPPEGDQLDVPFKPDDLRIFEWSSSPTTERLRLTIAHRGALFHFGFSSGDAFGRSVLDNVACSWSISVDSDDSDDEDRWYNHGYRSELKHSAAVLSCEAHLLEVALDALPRVIKEFEGKNEVSVAGAQLLINLKMSPTSLQPEANLVGDLYRDVLIDHLVTLEEGDFANIPRIELGAFTAYVLRMMSSQAFLIQLDQKNDKYLSSTIFFKTYRPRKLLQVEDLPVPGARSHIQEVFLNELKSMIETPFHLNVVPSPRALITIATDASDSGPGRVTKVVGWVQAAYSAVRATHRDDDSHGAARRYLGFARDLCRGVRHLARNGFEHPDLSCDNLLMAAAGEDEFATTDRLLVADLERLTYYNNKDGPGAPEALGMWTAHLDARGALQYQRCNQADPTPRLDGIYDELAGMPEARERLLMYSLGCTLTQLLDLRLTFTGVDLSGLPGMVRRVCLSTAVQPGQDPKRDAWEAYFPAEVRQMAQRCVAEDPRERPLLDDMVKTMDEAVHCFTARTIRDVL